MDNKTAKSIPKELLNTFKKHGITPTPGGVVEFDIAKQEKVVKEGKRYDNSSWAKFPNDTIGKHKTDKWHAPEYITSSKGGSSSSSYDLVVLDIDSVKTVQDKEAKTISIPALDITIPYGFYTNTSLSTKYHLYYYVDREEGEDRIGKMIKGLQGLKIDILYGQFNVFDPHYYSPNFYINDEPIIQIPEALLEAIDAHWEEKDIDPSEGSSGSIVLYSNMPAYNLITSYLDIVVNKTNTKRKFKQKSFNTLYKIVVPKEYQKANTKKARWEDLKPDFSYDLINKMMVKLTSIKELDFYSHVMPLVYYIVEQVGYSNDSKQAKLAYSQILPSLPKHPSLLPVAEEDDDRTLQELMDSQPDTDEPMFITAHKGRKVFVKINRFTLEPVTYNKEYLMEQSLAEATSPERIIVNENGRQIWDEPRDFIMTINDAFEPQYFIGEDGRHTFNAATPHIFVKNASPSTTLRKDNIIGKILRSVIHPDLWEFMMYWYGETFYGSFPPKTIPWMATPSDVKGGSGKSMASITIPSKVLGMRATTLDIGKLGNFSIPRGLRLVSYEEGVEDDTRKSDVSLLLNHMKKVSGSTPMVVNYKNEKQVVEAVRLAQSGSSNSPLPITLSDRRIICMQPAHLDGIVPPLDPGVIATIGLFEDMPTAGPVLNSRFAGDVQEFANYVKAFHESYLQGDKHEITRHLIVEAPETVWHSSWLIAKKSYVASIIPALSNFDEFMGLIHEDRAGQDISLPLLIEYMLHIYNESVQKVELPWKWFTYVIPKVATEEHVSYSSKQMVSRALRATFTTPSGWAKQLHDQYKHILEDVAEEKIAFQVVKINLPETEYNKYKQWLADIYK